MPRIVHETTADRQAELDRRVGRARAAVAALPPRPTTERVHRSATAARAAALKIGIAISASAVAVPGGHVGVVELRPDQLWLRPEAEARGLRVVLL